MGVVYSQEQLILMSKFPVRVIAFDSEPEAQRRADKLCRELAGFGGKTLRVELKADDPGSATDKEIKQLRGKFLT